MESASHPGNELCYLGARQSVSVTKTWLAWGRSALAVVVVAILVALGVANIAMYTRWHEVEDGVLWGARSEGVTAIEVAGGSAAAAAGIVPGDVLIAVNGSSIDTPSDVI